MTRVLIIKTSSMGDVVHHLPVIADIRRQRPDAVIDWVVEEAYADLVRMTAGVTRVLPIALRRWRRSLGRSSGDERRAFLELLQAERYDVVLDTQGLLKSALVARRARLAEGGFRAGFSFRLAREPLARLFYDRGYAVDPRLHAIERMRVLAAQALGYAGRPLGPPRFELAVPATRFDWMSEAAAGDAVRARPAYAVLLHATARPEKAWPAARWAALIAILAAEDILPVLPWGNPRERDAAEELVDLALASPLTGGIRPVIAPGLSLPEAASLLAGARVVVGVDTGLLHLASALDVPTVGLFGATPRWRYAPYWSTHAINLGSFGELGAQPALATVVEALERLDVVVPGAARAAAARLADGAADSPRQASGT